MTTKKLSEIGRTRTPEVLIVALDMLDEKHEEELLTILTPAERREFAKLLVERWAWREDLRQTFEEFLEEQGI